MTSQHSIFSLRAEESSGLLLWQVSILWQRGIKKVLQPFDLTRPQFVLLASAQWLAQQEKEITQVSLANFTKIDPMTTSQVVRALQSKDLITREEHKTDTRAKVVAITDKGAELISQAVAKVEAFDDEFFSILENEQLSFNAQLHKLLTN